MFRKYKLLLFKTIEITAMKELKVLFGIKNLTWHFYSQIKNFNSVSTKISIFIIVVTR